MVQVKNLSYVGSASIITISTFLDKFIPFLSLLKKMLVFYPYFSTTSNNRQACLLKSGASPQNVNVTQTGDIVLL